MQLSDSSNSFRLLYVDFSVNIAVKEGCFNVYLFDLKVICYYDRKE
jgi:hypothetical protein